MERHDTYQELQPLVGKVKTLEEIKSLIGEYPRASRIVMCHGIFDPIHPGHRRLFEYASRIDGCVNSTLIVGVADDECATQDTVPPYIPQGLRAINLAAISNVDYVYVSKSLNPTPDILTLKPDYFVKGYSQNGDSPNQEKQAVSSYGGEVVIAPGDTSYDTLSYSEGRINLNHEQLIVIKSLINAEGVKFDNLKKTVEKFSTIKVDVVGDLIIDKYRHCTHLRQNSKGPYPSLRYLKTLTYVGGAGIVAKHLRALGAQTTFTTIIGTQRNISEADFALEDLTQFGIFINDIRDHNRPTTVKEQILANGQTVAQVDDLVNTLIPDEYLEKICHHLQGSKAHAVVCSDFRHGIFDRKSAKIIANHIPSQAFKSADSQVASRWGNILDFPSFDLITPNENEARFALSEQDTPIGPLAQNLHRASGSRFLILKLGADGIITHQRADKGLRAGFPLPSFAWSVVDKVGAGDALLATATATLAVSPNNIVQASILGNLGAALECSKSGNIPVTAEELLLMTEKLEESLKQI